MLSVKNLLLLFVLVTAIGCNNDAATNPDTIILKDTVSAADTVIKGNFMVASGIRFDSSHIQEFLTAYPAFKNFGTDLTNFYRANNYNYVWYHQRGLIEFAQVLETGLQQQDQEGLTDSIPYHDEYLRMINHQESSTAEKTGPDLNTELMMTAQYFNYANRVYQGAAGEKVKNWYLPRKKLSYDSILQSNLTTGQLASPENRVVAPQYEGLKKALARYREIEKKGQEIKLTAVKKAVTLKVNDSSDLIMNVQKRLQELGYMAENETTDSALLHAVSLFRQTHGLNAAPIVDNAMISELNVPVHKRIETLIVNMERMRWIPESPASDEFILINIPEFFLHYYENGQSAWDCRVVIGTPMTRTVIFSGLMQYVVFSPYWYVPPSIINKEIKPGIKRNPNYLAKHNMEWNGGNVRQKPGPSNSLGLVKFLFPNSNNIYLHDTPSKSLFNEDQRAFSHGCIRVQKPRDLAIRILRQDSTWTESKIDAAMKAGTEKWVTLKKKIPVYIGYFTAFMDKEGNLNFRKDVYNRDQELLGMLMNMKK